MRERLDENTIMWSPGPRVKPEDVRKDVIFHIDKGIARYALIDEGFSPDIVETMRRNDFIAVEKSSDAWVTVTKKGWALYNAEGDLAEEWSSDRGETWHMGVPPGFYRQASGQLSWRWRDTKRDTTEAIDEPAWYRRRPREDTMAALGAEIVRARTKFPGNRFLYTALAEEFGELARAILQKEGRNRVCEEALQVACVAMRLYEEGDSAYDDLTDEEAKP